MQKLIITALENGEIESSETASNETHEGDLVLLVSVGAGCAHQRRAHTPGTGREVWPSPVPSSIAYRDRTSVLVPNRSPFGQHLFEDCSHLLASLCPEIPIDGPMESIDEFHLRLPPE
jgi:hypothetical protein